MQKGKAIPFRARRQTVGVEVHLHSLSTLELGNCMPWLLHAQGKKPCYPLNMSLGGPCRWCIHSGEHKMFCPWQELNSWTSSPQPSHSLYWLCYPSFTTTKNHLTSFQVYGVEFSMVYTRPRGLTLPLPLVTTLHLSNDQAEVQCWTLDPSTHTVITVRLAIYSQ